MFFTFTPRKLLVIGTLFVFLFIGISSALFMNSRFKVGEAFNLYARSVGENMSYWWSNKVFGKGNGAFTNYPEGSAEARSIPVLVYHGLPDEGGGENPFSAVKFSEQMSTLNKAGWKTVTLEQFRAFIRGEIKLPEKTFLLTFDDGRKDTFYPSDPILKDLGMSAVMFAITKKSISPTAEQSTYYMSPYELNAMEKSDYWEVESHGRDSHDWYYIDDKENIGHFFSNLLWSADQKRVETKEEFRDRVAYDLSSSKSDLESTLGKKITAIAFPFSDYGQDGVNYPDAPTVISSEVSKYYNLAFYQVWNNIGETFNYQSGTEIMMKRIEPLSDWNGERLLDVLESGISKDLPYSRSMFGSEWRQGWGTVSGGDNVALQSANTTSGASSALNGSWWWRDYTFSTDVTWTGGSNVVLIGRRQDDDNYFGCNFGKGKIYIKTVVNGSSRNLTETNYTLPQSGDIRLGLYAKGADIGCLVNNQVVLEAPGINQRIANGGVGLEIWDAKNGVAKASFDNIEVVAK